MYSQQDHIVFKVASSAQIEGLIDAYFTDPYISHNGVEIDLYQDELRKEVILNFKGGIDGELFMFFFTSISLEKEIPMGSYTGWFKLDDHLFSNPGFGKLLDDSSLSSSIVLTGEMTEDYTLGFSDQEERIEFHYSGECKVTKSEGFFASDVGFTKLAWVKHLSIAGNSSKFEKLKKPLGCVGVLAIMAIVASGLTFVLASA